jgi:hypothetical protein
VKNEAAIGSNTVADCERSRVELISSKLKNMIFKTIFQHVSRLSDKYLGGRSEDGFGGARGSATQTEPTRFTRVDVLIAACFSCIAVAVSMLSFAVTSHEHGLLEYGDIWFQADIARVIDNMTNIGGSHWRTSVHPITSILFYPIGFLLTKLGLSNLQAGRAIMVTFCALNPATLFFVLRQLRLPRAVAALFVTLFLSSAAVIFWSSVVELYPIACFSILPALYLMASARRSRPAWWIIASAFTLSITVTNWAVGLIATFMRWRLKPFVLITLTALLMVLSLSIAQFFIFKDARVFIDPHGLKWDAVSFSGPVMQHRGLLGSGWHPLENLEVLYVKSAVVSPAMIDKEGQEYVDTNQASSFPRGTYSGLIASFAWVALLLLGIFGAIKNRAMWRFSVGLGLMLLANGVLHSLYGQVTFLYSMHVIPLLTILSAMSWFTAYRRIGMGLAVVVVLAGGWNNWVELRQSANLAGQIGSMPGVSVIQAYSATTP